MHPAVANLYAGGTYDVDGKRMRALRVPGKPPLAG